MNRPPRTIRPTERGGLTLLEIVLAVTISAVFAVATLVLFRRPGDHAMEQVCTAQREMIREAVLEYRRDLERLPTIRRGDLTTAGYWTGDLPTCPTRGQSYSRTGDRIRCPVHGTFPGS